MLSKTAMASPFILHASRMPSRVLRQQHYVISSALWSSRPQLLIPTRFSTSASTRQTGNANALSITAAQVRPLSTWNSSKVSSSALHSNGCDQFHSSSRSYSNVFDTESITYPSTWKAYSDIEIKRIELAPSNDRVNVTWNDNKLTSTSSSPSSSSSSPSSFPLIWLRDNCRCPQCFNPDAKSRQVPFKNLDANSVRLNTVSLDDDFKSVSFRKRLTKKKRFTKMIVDDYLSYLHSFCN